MCALPLLGQTPPPRVFYSDLESGPNTGWQHNLGVFVTLSGRDFGPEPGDVHVGAISVWNILYRSDTKIVFEHGPNVQSSNIVVFADGKTSNAVPLTVRAGNIYFVAEYGDDTADSSFQRPWCTIGRALEAMLPGDTTCIFGSNFNIPDIFDAAVIIQYGGEAGRPVALVAYPNTKPRIGSPNLDFGLRISNVEEAAGTDRWVISQLSFQGRVSALAEDFYLNLVAVVARQFGTQIVEVFRPYSKYGRPLPEVLDHASDSIRRFSAKRRSLRSRAGAYRTRARAKTEI